MKNKLLDKLKFDPAEAIQQDSRAKHEAIKQKQLAKKYEQALKDKEAAERRLEVALALKDRKPAKPIKSKPSKGQKPHATAIVIFSDWHVGETVNPATVNGLNEYNPEIAKRRSEAVTQRALLLIDDARNLATVDTVVVALLGDFITGYIHEELQQTNSLSPINEVKYAAQLLESSMRTIIDQSGAKKIQVVTCVGNHGRTTKKTQHANRNDTSYETLLYASVEQATRDPRVQWDGGNGYVTLARIGNHRIRFTHGDSIKYKGGVGGMSIPVIKQLHNRNASPLPAEYDFFGHLHQWTPGTNWLCNGSLIGYSSYAIDLGCPYQEPLQSFALLDHERGMTRVMKLFCD